MIGYTYFGKEKAKKRGRERKKTHSSPIEAQLYTHVASPCRGRWHASNVTYEGSV